MVNKFPNDNVTCIGPWYETRINADGSRNYCHASLKDHRDNSPENLLHWFNNSEYINNIRSLIKSGTPVSGCNNCYNNEKLGIISFRERRNIQAAIYHNDFFKESLIQSPAYKRLSDTPDNIYPAFLHITLSNLCNMGCRMCFPEFSSVISSAYKKINKLEPTKETLLDWTNDSEKWNDFLQFIKNNNNIMSLHFMGGEPLYHKRFTEFIDWCIDNNKTDFHFTFVTNASIYRSDLFEKISKFKSVHIELSIETFHQTNEYIRTGIPYKTIEENIKKYIANSTPNVHVALRTVPQALSILHYHTVIDFALENKIPVDMNILSNPRHLKCFVLPKDIKNNLAQSIRNRYSDLLTNNVDNTSSVTMIRTAETITIINHINEILSILEEQEPDDIETLRHKFVQHNLELDKAYEKTFNEFYPELFNFYEKYNKI